MDPPAWLIRPGKRPETAYRSGFESLDLKHMPLVEVEKWRAIWKEATYWNGTSALPLEELATLVRLRDEETIRFLLSRLEMGHDRSSEAADILSTTGQEWILPMLRKTLFLTREQEPNQAPTESDGFCEVLFETVTDYSFQTVTSIIRKSDAFTPWLKSWFAFVFEGRDYDHRSRKELMQRWWDLNRTRIEARDFLKLEVLELWPDERKQTERLHEPFNRADQIKALASSNPWIIRRALDSLVREPVVYLDQPSIGRVANLLGVMEESVGSSASHVLKKMGDDPVPELRRIVSGENPVARHLAAGLLLGKGITSAAERARCVELMVSSYGFRRVAPTMRFECMPLLKILIEDETRGKELRWYAANNWCDATAEEDLPFLSNLAGSEFPTRIRIEALSSMCRLAPEGTVPPIIKQLSGDPEMGPLIRQSGMDKPYVHMRNNLGKPTDGPVADEELLRCFKRLCSPEDEWESEHAARQLALLGVSGVRLLKCALGFQNKKVSGNAAMALLAGPSLPESERIACISAVLNAVSDKDDEFADFLATNDALRSLSMPRLRTMVADESIKAGTRFRLARQLAVWADDGDVKFLESLAHSNAPSLVRSCALHGLCRLLGGEARTSLIRELKEDPELGEVISIYRYL